MCSSLKGTEAETDVAAAADAAACAHRLYSCSECSAKMITPPTTQPTHTHTHTHTQLYVLLC